MNESSNHGCPVLSLRLTPPSPLSEHGLHLHRRPATALSLSQGTQIRSLSLSRIDLKGKKKFKPQKFSGRQPWPPLTLSLSLSRFSAQITFSSLCHLHGRHSSASSLQSNPQFFQIKQTQISLSPVGINCTKKGQKKKKKNKLSGVDPTATAAAPKMSPSSPRHHVRSSSATGISNIKQNQNFAAKVAAQRPPMSTTMRTTMSLTSFDLVRTGIGGDRWRRKVVSRACCLTQWGT